MGALQYYNILRKYKDYNEYKNSFEDTKHNVWYSNVLKLTNNIYFSKKFELFADFDKIGNPIYYTKKMTLFRWAWFIGVLALVLLLYLSIINVVLSTISGELKNWYEYLIVPIVIIPIIFFYSFVLTSITYLEEIRKNNGIDEDVIKIILFPFNKITKDVLAIHFIFGKQGLFVYAEMNTGGLLRSISYDNFDYVKEEYFKFFTQKEKEMITRLSNEYLSSR